MNNPFAQIGLGQMANAAQNYYGNLNSQQYQAQQAQQAMAFAQYAQQHIERREWMIDGKPMTLKEFADTLWPEDCPDRTMFYLKYSK